MRRERTTVNNKINFNCYSRCKRKLSVNSRESSAIQITRSTLLVMPPLSLTSSSTRFRIGFFVLLAISFSFIYHFAPSFSSHRSTSQNEQTGSSEYLIDVNSGKLQGQNRKRIAIVGAGASGSSAAFFLRRAANVIERRAGLAESTLIGDILVYEKEGYVGGRMYNLHIALNTHV